MTELGRDDAAVDGEVVGVRDDELLAFDLDVGQHRHLDDLELLARRVRLLAEARQVVVEALPIGIGAVGRGLGEHDARSHELGDVVGVAVRVAIFDQAVPQPDHLLDAEVGEQQRLDVLAREARVAVGIEQHGLRGDQRALAVERQPAALGHERCLVDAHPEQLRKPGRQLRIVGERRVLAAPGVEAEVHGGHAAAAVHDEDRPVVAHPGVVDRELGVSIGNLVPTGSRGTTPGRTMTVTGSCSAMASTTAAYSASASLRNPFQRPWRHGQETNVRACSAVLLGTNNASSRGSAPWPPRRPDGWCGTVSAASSRLPRRLLPVPDTRGP